MIYVELVVKFIAPHLDWTDRLLRLRWMVGLADRKNTGKYSAYLVEACDNTPAYGHIVIPCNIMCQSQTILCNSP